MGSGGGMASVGFYGAGKAALDSVSEALTMEVEQFGIKVTVVQVGGYATGLFTAGTVATTPDPAYASLRARMEEMWGDDAGPDPATGHHGAGRNAGPGTAPDRRRGPSHRYPRSLNRDIPRPG
jgi:NAD(P)-dependent dehydrogenase (short-subunit alcohol dehydrogenase family)